MIEMNIKSYLQICIAFFLVPASSWTQHLLIDRSEYDATCGTEITIIENGLQVSWQVTETESSSVVFNFNGASPLIDRIDITDGNGISNVIARNVHPAFILTVGERDLEKRDGWNIFFDKVHHKPYDSYTAKINPVGVKVTSVGRRCTVEIDSLHAGPFEGSIAFIFYANSPLIQLEGWVQSSHDGRAIVYDAGIVSEDPVWNSIAWTDVDGHLTHTEHITADATSLKVRHRVIAAEGGHGCIAVFPTPHQYFYPLDFSDNFNFNWFGRNYRHKLDQFGIGVRLPLDGDKRYVPWFNAPPGTQQKLSFFLLVSSQPAKNTLNNVGQFTRNDQFKKLPGQVTFSSHYHIEHTLDLVSRQPDTEHWSPDSVVIPADLIVPEFVQVFENMGVDIVHLAEFHNGRTPKLMAGERLPLLELMHKECERLSNRHFLLLPGEEPNVHLGGHWISFFPKPIYWVLNNTAARPFVEDHKRYGKVYHLENQTETLELFKQEGGLMWTTHPRIKGSTGFPDRYREEAFYQSDQFLGGAWKNMPTDLSKRRLGDRVLTLQDDMANWSARKYILGEVDVFKVNLDHEQYAHMNVNYLRLDEIPLYSEGWQPVLDALRSGSYFTTTGEVLIPEFSVDGMLSGETQQAKEHATVRVKLEWTFPMNHFEIVSGDGKNVYHKQIALPQTESFDAQEWEIEMDLRDRKWIRLEAWDIARNGAFSPPVWLED